MAPIAKHFIADLAGPGAVDENPADRRLPGDARPGVVDPNNVAVDANGMRVPRNDSDGWRYGPNMTSIELTGSWCTRIQSGAITDIKATFACAEVVIP